MLSELTRTRLAEGAGTIVSAGPSRDLASVDGVDLVELLAEHGCVVLRGFDTDPERFSTLVRSVSSRITIDPARRFAGGDVAQKIEAGLVPQGLHVENGATPWVPDLVWFYCERPATVGSQTTVCDGSAVWERLSGRTRSRFLDQRISFARAMPEERWTSLVWRLLDGRRPRGEVTFDDLLEVTDDAVDVKYQLLPDGAVHYTYFVHAARPTLLGGDVAFANSILTPSVNYEPPVIEFEDGTPLDAMLMREILEATALETDDVDWEAGDVALVDNSRMMHGRRKIRDVHRSLFNAQSYLLPDIVDRVRHRRHRAAA